MHKLKTKTELFVIPVCSREGGKIEKVIVVTLERQKHLNELKRISALTKLCAISSCSAS